MASATVADVPVMSPSSSSPSSSPPSRSNSPTPQSSRNERSTLRNGGDPGPGTLDGPDGFGGGGLPPKPPQPFPNSSASRSSSARKGADDVPAVDSQGRTSNRSRSNSGSGSGLAASAAAAAVVGSLPSTSLGRSAAGHAGSGNGSSTIASRQRSGSTSGNSSKPNLNAPGNQSGNQPGLNDVRSGRSGSVNRRQAPQQFAESGEKFVGFAESREKFNSATMKNSKLRSVTGVINASGKNDQVDSAGTGGVTNLSTTATAAAGNGDSSSASAPVAGRAPFSVEDSVREVERRLRILQGEQKNLVETSQDQLRTLRDEMSAVKRENAELQETLLTLKRESQASNATVSAASGSGAGGAGGSAAGGNGGIDGAGNYMLGELRRLQEKMDVLKKQYDNIQFATRNQEREHDSLRVTHASLVAESRTVVTGDFDSPLARIRALQNRLDKVLVKHSEAQLIRKTYERIVKRLEDEKTGFDAQLSAIQRTLVAKQNDILALETSLTDARRAKQQAGQDVNGFRVFFREELERRGRELSDRQQYLQQRADLLDRVQQREIMRQRLLEADGRTADERQQFLKEQLTREIAVQSVIELHTDQLRTTLSRYNDAFHRIQRATGVKTLDEIMTKCLSQDETRAALEREVLAAETQVHNGQRELNLLQNELHEVRFTGDAAPESARRRQAVDYIEHSVTAADELCTERREKYERIRRVMIGLKSGVQHLLEMLDIPEIVAGGGAGHSSSSHNNSSNNVLYSGTDEPGGGNGSPTGSSAGGAFRVTNDESIPVALVECERRLLKMIESMSHYGGRSPTTVRSTGRRSFPPTRPFSPGNSGKIPVPPSTLKLSPYNVRISFPKAAKEPNQIVGMSMGSGTDSVGSTVGPVERGVSTMSEADWDAGRSALGLPSVVAATLGSSTQSVSSAAAAAAAASHDDDVDGQGGEVLDRISIKKQAIALMRAHDKKKRVVKGSPEA